MPQLIAVFHPHPTMMDATDGAGMLDEEKNPTQSVELSTDTSLMVDISDALSERDLVKFTVHTKTTLPYFKESEFSVVREHKAFVWLHDRYVENEEYAGITIPPAPPKPDFDVPHKKLDKLLKDENTMTREEFQKMKQEFEAEYCELFKKAVAMHEVFLTSLAAHPTLRKDSNFTVFLEYEGELNMPGKNMKEWLGGFLKGLAKRFDEVLLSGQKGQK